MNHFGERLRRLRGERSQRSVAEALDIPQTTLSSLEKQSAIPRGDVLKMLADFYGVSVEYFYAVPAPKASEEAKAWLHQLRVESKGRDTVATHSTQEIDSNTLEKIADKLRQKYAETSDE
jgi:transcriptional regulator with XRE-family HTH domain